MWTTYARDARKWVTMTTSVSPLPQDLPRINRTYWTDDGLAWKRTFGASETFQELNLFDGFGRLRQATDSEGRVSHYRYNSRGSLTARWLDGDTAGQTLFWHDAFGRTQHSWKNGVTLAAYDRLPGGAVYAASGDGRGKHYVTYDAVGAVAWTEDSAGDRSIFTETSAGGSHVVTASRMRGGAALTSGIVSKLDGLGRVYSETEKGGSLARETAYDYDVAGNLWRVTAPDTTQTTASYDWLGRPLDISRQVTWGGTVETSHYTYNAQGLLESTIDPAGYEVVQWYNGFGEPSHQSGPASRPSNWEYDEFGRKTRHTVGSQCRPCRYRSGDRRRNRRRSRHLQRGGRRAWDNWACKNTAKIQVIHGIQACHGACWKEQGVASYRRANIGKLGEIRSGGNSQYWERCCLGDRDSQADKWLLLFNPGLHWWPDRQTVVEHSVL